MAKNIGKTELKLIRKYARLRGRGHIEYQEDCFVEAYKTSTPKERELFLAEAKHYIESVDKKEIKAGEHIRKSIFAG